MVVADIVALIILAFFAVRAALKGFVMELVTLISLFGGILIAVVFAPLGARLLDVIFAVSAWNKVIAFLMIYLLVNLIFRLLGGALDSLIERVHLDNLDRALGFFLGLVEGTILILLGLFLINIQPWFDPTPLQTELFSDAVFPKLLDALLPWLELLPENL
jgi:membrane protein required for colicin V production